MGITGVPSETDGDGVFGRRPDGTDGQDETRHSQTGASLAVLQVIPDLDAGGAERTTIEVAEALVGAGHRAIVASSGGRLVPELEALGSGAQLVPMPAGSKNPITMAANAVSLLKLITAQKIDLVHARSRAPAWSALWAARRSGVPFVTTYHGAYGGRSALKKWYNGVMARGDMVIANSRYIGDHVARRYGLGDDRLRVIPRGVNVPAFTPSAVSDARVAAMRAAWEIAGADNRPVFLLPGRLTRWKGQGLALEAFALLKQRTGIAPILVLAGDDQGRVAYRQELIEAANRAGMSDRVRIPGHCDDMPAAFRACDFVLAPSTQPEAFGRVAAEAQCAGRLVIAADHGGQRETVDPAVGGWRVPPSDPRALAMAMGEACDLARSQRVVLENAVMNRACAQYSTHALQIATLAVYAECVAKRTHGQSS